MSRAMTGSVKDIIHNIEEMFCGDCKYEMTDGERCRNRDITLDVEERRIINGTHVISIVWHKIPSHHRSR